MMIEFNDERSPRADARRNHEHLLAVARRLFEARGVAHVPMSAIAEEAQVGKGTLYRHFADKAALCLALLDEDMRTLQTRVFETLAQPARPSDKLRWFVAEACRYVLTHADYLCELSAHSSAQFLQDPAHRWWWQTLYGLLRQSGIGDMDAQARATALYVLLDAQALRFQQAQFQLDEAGLLARLDLLVDALIA